MSNFPEPREFQRNAIQRLRECVIAGKNRLVLSAPTGSGKTYLGLLLAKSTMDKGKRAMFICDRVELIDQTLRTAVSYGIRDIGVIQADHPLQRDHASFLIASSQTLARRKWPDVDLTIIDEAHTIYKTWVDKLKKNPMSRAIGLTATPFTKGMGQIFDGMVQAAVMSDLVASGVLVPPKFYGHKSFDMRGAKTKSGEYDTADMTKRGMPIIGDIVQGWKDRANGLKTICFVPSVEFGEYLATQFGNAGIVARVVSYKTPDSVRKTYIQEFRQAKSSIDILISVDALAKGFDVTDVGCVIDARPLRKSFSSYVQMIGRGLRSHEGKTQCIVIDHSGNIDRFGKAFEELYHDGVDTLDDGEKKDNEAKKSVSEGGSDYAGTCPQCGFTPFAKICMACGYVKPRKTTTQAIVAGKMVEVDIGIRASNDDIPILFREISTYLQTSTTPPEKRPYRLATLYHNITGYWPKKEWLHLPLLPTIPSARTLALIKRENLKWLKYKGILK